MTDLFERASREKFRYPSFVGMLSTEQLWELPLTSAKSASLDNTAKLINTELKAAGEESFVETAASNPSRALLAAKLDIVKRVIEIRMAENEAKASAAAKKAEKERLTAILADKQDEALKSLSAAEIQKRLAEL